MGHLWWGILVILMLDALLVAVVAAIAFLAMRAQGADEKQARRFAEAVVRQDFAAAEAAATQAMTDAPLSPGGREQR
jgi:uncharacterized membrane protein